MWDVKSGEVVYAYNTVMQESTKHTPFEAMLSRMAGLPVDFNSANHYDPNTVLEECCTSDKVDEIELLAGHHKTEQAIKENIANAQETQK